MLTPAPRATVAVRPAALAQRSLLVRLLAASFVALAALVAVLATATPAAAHAALTGSDPAQGAVVSSAPEEVALTFSEQVAMNDDSIRVLDPGGDRVDTGELRDLCNDSVVRYGVGLRAGLADGTYTVAWQAVSADSHPVSGAFTFSVGAPSETSVELPNQQVGGGPVGELYDASRYFAYGGFLLLFGGAAFVLTAWRGGAAVPALRRLVVGGWLTSVVATLVTLLLRHPYTTGGGVPDAFDLSGLSAVVETKTGTALVSRLLLLAVAALFVAVLFGTFQRRAEARSAREQRDLYVGLVLGGAVLTLGIAATWAMAEHASTGLQPQLAIPVALVHLLAMAVWLGGLTALLTVLYRGDRAVPREAVRRFSSLAFGSVVALVATGLYQSWRQLGSWSALTGTEYGRLLIAKLVLFVVLLGAAWYSRRWVAALSPAGERGREQSARPDDSRTEKSSSPEPVDSAGRPAGEAAPTTEVGTKSRVKQETSLDQVDPDRADELAPETEPAAEQPGDSPAEEATSPEPVDAVRAAQLARQAAAVAQARQRRERDADPERAGLRRTVLVEAAVAAVLLAVTTMLTGTEPGRTAEAATNASGASAAVPDRPVELSLPFDTGGPGGEGTAQLELDPGRTGDNVLQVRTDVPAEEVRVAFTLPKEDIGPLPIVPKAVGQDAAQKQRHWSAKGVQLPRPGTWRIAVTIRTSDIDQITETRTVKIG